MATATRLDTDMGGWMPVARHYEVDGGWLVVVVYDLFGNKGAEVFYANEFGGAMSMEAIVRLPENTTHEQALNSIGYDTVIDEIGDVPDEVVEQHTQQLQQSVIEMLPPEIISVISENIEFTE